MSQQRPITCRGNTRSYIDGNESDEPRSPRGDTKTRKRNSVACSRCRKRKIKCTGDLLDGNGCEACQAAGVPRSSCHYLRVNSHHLGEIPLQGPSDSEWPYAMAPPANYNRLNTEPSQYSLANGSHVSQSTTSPYASPGVPYSTAQARPPFPTSYSTTYTGQYDVQRPIQGSHLHLPQGPTASYPASEYPQQWHTMPPHSRTSSHNLLYDPDPPRYETSTVSYVTSSGTSGTSVPNVAAEGSSIFPGLSPLVTHLPAHGGHRTLPDPVTIHSSFDSSNSSVQGGSSGHAGLYQQLLDSSTSQGSVCSASQDASCATSHHTVSTASSPTETPDMPSSSFAYLPMSRASPSASSENASSGGFQSLLDASSTTSTYTASSPPSTTNPSNRPLRNLNSPFDGYGGAHNRGSRASDRALEPGMAIRNGGVYDPHGRPRILQPQPRRSPEYDLLKGPFEGGSGKHHPANKVGKAGGHGRKSDGKR